MCSFSFVSSRCAALANNRNIRHAPESTDFPAHPIRNAPASNLFLGHVAPSVYQRYRNDAKKTAGAWIAAIYIQLTPPAATAGKRFVLKTCGSPTWDSQNILYFSQKAGYNANLKMAQDNFEGNLCLAATGTTNEDVIETKVCNGDDSMQAWGLEIIEALPQHLSSADGGH